MIPAVIAQSPVYFIVVRKPYSSIKNNQRYQKVSNGVVIGGPDIYLAVASDEAHMTKAQTSFISALERTIGLCSRAQQTAAVILYTREVMTEYGVDVEVVKTELRINSETGPDTYSTATKSIAEALAKMGAQYGVPTLVPMSR